MLLTIIDFADLLLAALVVGAMFGVWLLFNPAGLAAGAYTVLQQRSVRSLNCPMPALGAATILATIAAAVFGPHDGARMGMLAATTICFVASGLITRFQNQPINRIVMTWSSDAPPADWRDLRDAWCRWHRLRLLAGLGGLSLLIAAMLTRG